MFGLVFVKALLVFVVNFIYCLVLYTGLLVRQIMNVRGPIVIALVSVSLLSSLLSVDKNFAAGELRCLLTTLVYHLGPHERNQAPASTSAAKVHLQLHQTTVQTVMQMIIQVLL